MVTVVACLSRYGRDSSEHVPNSRPSPALGDESLLSFNVELVARSCTLQKSARSCTRLELGGEEKKREGEEVNVLEVLRIC
jgi:hypothetical protein